MLVLASEAREHGILSFHWVKRNLYHANIGFPGVHHIKKGGEVQTYLRPNIKGTGIWWTTPLLLWLFVDARRVFKDKSLFVLLGSGIAVFCLLMLWHATGEVQRGYNRYSLNYLALFLAAIVPACIAGRRRWITLGMIAWSLVYFQILLPLPHLRIW